MASIIEHLAALQALACLKANSSAFWMSFQSTSTTAALSSWGVSATLRRCSAFTRRLKKKKERLSKFHLKSDGKLHDEGGVSDISHGASDFGDGFFDQFDVAKPAQRPR